MLTLALTGGIATGKTTVTELFREFVPDIVIFDCDVAVAQLLQSPEVIEEIREKLGAGVIDPETRAVIKPGLRALILADPSKRKVLENILHPRVREQCLALKEISASNEARCFLADVPLLYENGFDFGQQQTLVVSCTQETQIKRLEARGGWDKDSIQAILSAQLSLEEKTARADVVFWNEGAPSTLNSQVYRFCKIFPPLSMPDTSQKNMPSKDRSPVPETEQKLHPVPAHTDLNELRKKPLSELQTIATGLPARIPGGIPKTQLIYEIACFYLANEGEITCEGVLEFGRDKFAMIRDSARSFRPSPDDIHLGGPILADTNLRNGQALKVKVRKPVQRDKYLTTAEILEVEGIPFEKWVEPQDFEKLTPMFPDSRIHLEGEGAEYLGVRVIDLIAPLGKGQRGLIVAPPRGGKTILLKQIAKSIKANNPEVELVILLLDERPEEVTDFEETVDVPVFASTFDETPRRHAQVADLVIARAQRMVELGKHVVLLLDSLTRLARGHNSANQGGPIGSGGVSPAALQKSRKFFGTARNIENGGSLTILATALVETESRLDDVVFEEFKGTGNMEVRLDRELAERRVYPAIHIPQSGTRNDDRLYHPDEFQKVIDVRKQLAALPIGDALVLLLDNLRPTKSNTEFLLRGLR